jgi:hypothetical protein
MMATVIAGYTCGDPATKAPAKAKPQGKAPGSIERGEAGRAKAQREIVKGPAMSLSMYEAAFPPVIRTLGNLSAILDKAAAHCEARKIDPSVLMHYRLAPDMYALPRQFQVATDQAKGMAARLAGLEVPSYPDTESTIDELKARLAKTLEFVKSVPQSRVEGSEDRDIVLKLGGRELRLTGRGYVFGFVLPNFYFHAATAYDLLRHAGVELGKRDFIGAL